MNRLNRQLKDQAVSLGLCRQWQSEWDEDRTDSQLAVMFRKGQDFAIQHDFPSLDFIRQNFPSPILEANGIYVDAVAEERLLNGTYILLGDCNVTLNFPRWTAAIVYLRHNSRATINAAEFCKIQIRLYDQSEAEVSKSDDARVRIFDRR